MHLEGVGKSSIENMAMAPFLCSKGMETLRERMSRAGVGYGLFGTGAPDSH